MLQRRKLPIGIQDFEDLRTNNYLYVDKTAYIYQLVNFGKPYFLSRPRRFGKSLFLSTLKAYFLGQKALFEGLAIAELEKDWVKYPVIYIDFNKDGYSDAQSLELVLDEILTQYELEWKMPRIAATLPLRFNNLIQEMSVKTGQKAVVLVDEYDKPLINTMDDNDKNEEIRKVLKSFYGILKSADNCLRFVFLTGVTKFSKVSIFSDLNQLQDISMNENFAGICGISESELINTFQPEIESLAEKRKLTHEATLAELKKRYDGYHFAKESENIYNPFSLLNTFANRDFSNYWFASGTPTLLVQMLKKLDFKIEKLESDIKISGDSVSDYRIENDDPVPLLYQTGYLTIKSYNERFKSYTLGFPNEEVKYGFFNELMPAYMPKKNIQSEFYVAYFIEDLQAGNVESFMTRLKAFFAGISYELNNKEEKHYQTVFYLLFKLMGQFIEVEQRSAIGRADAIVITDDTVFAFEFKLTGSATAENALKQIGDKNYLIPFTAGNKKLVKIGAEFSNEERGISRWVVG